jgi:hypothetical protein
MLLGLQTPVLSLGSLIDGIPLVNISATTIVTLVVLMILTGRLVPRRTYDDLIADRDAWRTTAQAQGEVIEELKVLTRSTNAVLAALPAAAERVRKKEPT